ncbi:MULTISPECIES: HAD family hydrolase [Streptacidiphilus]|uniref:HAD family hydrolase n=1 Tax=Streptacidiphilus cavernicola TaxID=3342716 RepID=A0ABV6UGP6_9ACTN|nr:HAD family hydrolase [Streptacidiphilus jeojiense]
MSGTSGKPSRPYDLIATDLDGTLLRSDHTVSERTRRALAAAAAAGAQHIVVTGRSASWTRPTLDAIGYTGLAVCSQGGQVYDAGAHRLLTSITLDRKLAQVALAKIEAEAGPVFLAVGREGLDGEILVGEGYRMPGDGEGEEELRAVTDPAEFWAEPITRLFLQHPTLTDDELTQIVREVGGQLVDVVMAGPGFVEVLPLGLSKATGLALAAARLGVKRDRALAFGDMPNDLPMFAWAAHGVAMANAHPALVAAADEVTSSNDADGVAVVLELLFPTA